MRFPVLTAIEGHRFHPDQLEVGSRTPGISAFMRARNAADFIEVVIRSHLPYYDEIVVVINQCTDDTESILLRMMEEFPDRVRGFHYLDRVLPLGHSDYASMAFDDPASMANYSSVSLEKTRHTVAVKLDDDHLCLAAGVGPIVESIRDRECRLGSEFLCFSGFNVFRDGVTTGLLASDPVVGSGDHGYFEVSSDTWFENTAKHERFRRDHLQLRFTDFAYLHLKFLKEGQGFGNYELQDHPGSRFGRKQERFLAHQEIVSPEEFAASSSPSLAKRLLRPMMPAKVRLKIDRSAAARAAVGNLDLDAMMEGI
jgi:hypothetical protein